MKSKLRNPIVQQYALEIVLPIIGYFFFDWSIAVIIAFYFIDYFCSEIARFRRYHKIRIHWNESPNRWILSLVISLVVFNTLAYLTMYAMTQAGSSDNSTVHLDQVSEFFASEGWFILPLVYLANYMKDSLTFYAPRRFTKYNFKNTIKAYFIEVSVFAVVVAVGVLVWGKYDIPDVLSLLVFIAVKLAYDQILLKQLQKMAMKSS